MILLTGKTQIAVIANTFASQALSKAYELWKNTAKAVLKKQKTQRRNKYEMSKL